MDLIKDDIDLTAYMEENVAVHKIKPASDWREAVIDKFYKPKDFTGLPKLPWKKTQDDFEFRRGEVTLWAGINGHGKTQMLNQVMLGVAEMGERVCFASFEMSPEMLMYRLTRQASGQFQPPIHYINALHAWTQGRIWIYDHKGSSDPKTVVAVIRYAVANFGIQHFVIDNMTKVVAGDDSYNDQKDFVNMLCTVAHDLQIHIHLVLHVRKGNSEEDVPNKFSIKGSGSITDMADNVFIVWRNKAKERLEREGNLTKRDEPDALLILDKQRNGETEGTYKFWYHLDSYQYLEDRHACPKQLKVEPDGVPSLR